MKSVEKEYMDTFKIKGEIKGYAWGTEDYIKSLVGIDADGVIAEYWLGTHYLGESKDYDGHLLSEKLSHRLSFLLKVLSISTPLALQCHPTLAQAKEGYKRENSLSISSEYRNYTDTNDKTEAAIALSDFTALCGFRLLSDIKDNLLMFVPILFEEIKDCSSVEELMIKIKELQEDKKESVLNQLKDRLKNIIVPSSSILRKEELCALCLSLYPDDIWCVTPLILNVIHLKAYESIFIEPGTIHAYCRGNCMEIMTSSDNMTRLGLTHRFKDENEFMRIADFREGLIESVKEEKTLSGAYSYNFHFPYFSLIRYESGIHDLPQRKDGVVFIIEGDASIEEKNETIFLKKGEAAYISEEAKDKIKVDGVVFFAYEKQED